MLIVADENIPFAEQAFGALGEVRLMPGRRMSAEALRDADILAVRSVTRVDRALLEGTRVRFVGTATIGADHVDLDYLREAGIAFSAAPGCNANSVSEYITAALLVLAQRDGCALEGRSIGVIGVGNVGSRVAAKAQVLGLKVLLNDPPLARRLSAGDCGLRDRLPSAIPSASVLRPIQDLMSCDIITLHVPLERGGTDPTYHLVDRAFLEKMKPGAVLINSSRGAVVDNRALLTALVSGRVGAAVLDVWEGEPDILPGLLERVAIGTPHIAGYSLDGKINGTTMIYRAACAFLGVAPTWDAAVEPLAKAAAEETWEISSVSPEKEGTIAEAVRRMYPIERDDAALRRGLALPQGEARREHFDRLRKEYPVRREFPNATVRLHGGDTKLANTLRGLGFHVISDGRSPIAD